jgi:hypothetical protein
MRKRSVTLTKDEVGLALAFIGSLPDVKPVGGADGPRVDAVVAKIRAHIILTPEKGGTINVDVPDWIIV